MRPFRTLRSRVLLLVVAVGLIPVAIIALWLTLGTARGGERVVRSRLQSALEQSERQIAHRWVAQRYALLFLVEHLEVQSQMRHAAPAQWQTAGLSALFEQLPGDVTAVTILDTAGVERWTAARPSSGERTLDVDIPIVGTSDGARLGTMRATLHAQALVPRQETSYSGAEAVLAVVDRASGRSLLPLPFDTAALQSSRFPWGEDEWIAERRSLREPPLTLVAAAPVTLIAVPFRRAAKRAAAGLAIVAVGGLVAAGLLSRRVTRPLEDLALAAGSVAQGELDRNVRVAGPAEVRNVAVAFNTMTAGLRQSLAVASEREALAAVGEFAAELAHEIRNPLGAMRLDLELIEEQLPPGSALREQQSKVIDEVERLSQVVGGALALARSGRITPVPVRIEEPLSTAIHYAAPRFEQRGGRVSLAVEQNDIVVSGDDHSLQRLFLNILLNAADAISDGGRCDVTVAAADGSCRVLFADDGSGMDATTAARATDAFFTTRAQGTGLGLAVATRIAQAHGGQLRIAATDHTGTAVEVVLPIT